MLHADDHTLFRKGVRTLLEQMPGVKVVGEAARGEEALTEARELVPDVVLMDIRMPGINGIEATRSILQENPHRRYPGDDVRRPRVGALGHARRHPVLAWEVGRQDDGHSITYLIGRPGPVAT